MNQASRVQAALRTTRAAAEKIIVAIGFAICLTGFGGIAGAAAHADPEGGTYDDQMNLSQEMCWGSVSRPVAWKIGDPESAGCAHSRT